MRTKLYAAVGSKAPRFAPHVNFGYTFGSDSDLFYVFGSEIGYAAGAEVVVNPRLTVIGDVLGRSIAKNDRLSEQLSTVALSPVAFLPAEVWTFTELQYDPRRLN